MKKLFLSFLLLSGCTPEYLMMPELPNEYEVNQSQVNTLLYNENGQLLLDFIPMLQSFVNEGCQTAWDNLSAIVNPDGSLTYFINLPDYTPDSTDLDKGRFTFLYQVQNPWYNIYPGEAPYTLLAGASWYTLPVDDYGNLTCQGLQEIRIWVVDELTGAWYVNSQVCWAGFLCEGQEPCDQGWTFDQIEDPNYTPGYLHLSPIPITNE